MAKKFVDNSGFPEGVSKHYHGDIVRVLFAIAAVLILSGLPFFQDQIPLPFSVSIGAAVLLVFLAGLTNPRQILVALADTGASLIGTLVFEYFAVTRFESVFNTFFLINQILAIVFLVALYYSTKTLRGFYLRRM